MNIIFSLPSHYFEQWVDGMGQYAQRFVLITVLRTWKSSSVDYFNNLLLLKCLRGFFWNLSQLLTILNTASTLSNMHTIVTLLLREVTLYFMYSFPATYLGHKISGICDIPLVVAYPILSSSHVTNYHLPLQSVEVGSEYPQVNFINLLWFLKTIIFFVKIKQNPMHDLFG